MANFNLLEMAKSYFNNELVSQAGSSLGETEGGITKALSAIIPSVIGGLADKASTNEGAHAVAQMAKEQNDSGILDSIGSFLHHESNSDLLSKSSGLISSLFGSGNSNMLTNLLSGFSGLKSSSIGSLLSMAVPTVLGLVGRHASQNNLSASDLANTLSTQKAAAMAALPAGFSLSSIAGTQSAAAKTTTHTTPTHTEHHTEQKSGGAVKFILPFLILAAVAGGALYFYKTRQAANEHTENSTTATPTMNTEVTGNSTNNTVATMPAMTVDSLTGVVNYDLGALGDLELPNGVKLTGVAANGFENNLVAFLKTGTIDTVNKTANWFTIHDVQFVSGKTAYATPKAMAQIKNVAAILKAYPNAILKIGGYTDITGDAAKNKALSQARATQLSKDIIANGAAASQIKEAVGYGSEFATAKPGDKEGMARDRRTAAKVSAK